MPEPPASVSPLNSVLRIFADSNIAAPAVRALRAAGFDVVYAGERATDPGDEALLAEATAMGRVFLTKDHDIGSLVHLSKKPHAGVLLIDDLGDAKAEAGLILAGLQTHGRALLRGAFLRASASAVRRS